jgi:hypothetical protein
VVSLEAVLGVEEAFAAIAHHQLLSRRFVGTVGVLAERTRSFRALVPLHSFRSIRLEALEAELLSGHEAS